MKKNKTLKMFLSHSQKDSEIFTNNLEEKQEKMPPSQEEKARKRRFQSPKAGKTLLFSLGKQCFCRGKTCNLMWENQRFALLKQAFQPAQASWLVRFGKGRVSKNKNFPAKKKANRKI